MESSILRHFHPFTAEAEQTSISIDGVDFLCLFVSFLFCQFIARFRSFHHRPVTLLFMA